VLAGTALSVSVACGRRSGGPLAVGVLGSVLAALAANALYRYFAGIQIAYGWKPFTPMAVHTALGFGLLAAGLIALAWRDGASPTAVVPRWSPVLVSVAVLTLSAGQWRALHHAEPLHVEAMVETDSRHLENEILSRTRTLVDALTRMANRLASRPDIARREWESDVQQFLIQDRRRQSCQECLTGST
jgi:hypothetical protein